MAIVDTLQFVPGKCWRSRMCAVIGFHQHRAICVDLIIQPDKRLLVAVGGDVKTAIDAAPGRVRVKPLTAFYQNSPVVRRVTLQPSDSSLVWYEPSEKTFTTGDAAFSVPSLALVVLPVVYACTQEDHLDSAIPLAAILPSELI
ncbi:hypothetical protein F854_gp25 [Escherichia phage mEpX1]|uniref:Uncharacterized protein n=1 Tax=Escherichia phage mEpX1 TaxID=1147153 RepID=K7PJL9_9CAUD|nr:hypothetical protein F854_gp25 [Escherichia phage mEpX1]AFM75996.1 hypothetical protein mEpX1_025 [Escherichia phage mEpX1]